MRKSSKWIKLFSRDTMKPRHFFGESGFDPFAPTLALLWFKTNEVDKMCEKNNLVSDVRKTL